MNTTLKITAHLKDLVFIQNDKLIQKCQGIILICSKHHESNIVVLVPLEDWFKQFLVSFLIMRLRGRPYHMCGGGKMRI